MKTERWKPHPLNPGEAKSLKATIERLTALAAKQALLAVVNILSTKIHLPLKLFEEIIDDAWRLAQLTNDKGRSAVEYAVIVAGGGGRGAPRPGGAARG